jgi:hypothetical protein
MPNVTISVPDELKAEMDKLSEVNWSEISRKAISEYIAQRKNPHPTISLDLREARLEMYYPYGQPSIMLTLNIHNKMAIKLTIDRILFNVRFRTNQESREFRVGLGFDLNRRALEPNSISNTVLSLPLFKWKLEELEGNFSSTFPCIVECTVIADGFNNPYHQEVRTEIPIDRWLDFQKKVLNKGPRL